MNALLAAASKSTAAFDPLSLSPSAFAKGPNYNNTPESTWTATAGSNVVNVATDASDLAARTAVSGTPKFDYSASGVGLVHLQSTSFPLSSWAGTGNHWLWCQVLCESIITTTAVGASYSANAAGISDAGGYLGIHFRRAGAPGSYTYFAGFYEWDSSSHVAEVEITDLLSSGVGSVSISGKREGNAIFVKRNSDAWVAGDTGLAATGSSAGQLRIGYSLDGRVKAYLARASAPTDAEANNMATWGAALT